MVIKTARYNTYKDGRKLLGLADSIDMPEITARTEDAEVPGGTISVPIPGQFESTEMSIGFQQFFGDIFSMINTRETVALTLRIANEKLDGAGNITMVPTRISVVGIPKSISPGTYKNGTSTGASVTLGVHYLYIEQNGMPQLEIDYLNGVYRVNGRNMLADIESMT